MPFALRGASRCQFVPPNVIIRRDLVLLGYALYKLIFKLLKKLEVTRNNAHPTRDAIVGCSTFRPNSEA
jgi:hypothetical protein